MGDVIAALTSNETFVPYRNHKLTELMRDSLGGNAKTLMIVNLSPLQKDAVETKNSLDYASRVKQVSNHLVIYFLIINLIFFEFKLILKFRLRMQHQGHLRHVK